MYLFNMMLDGKGREGMGFNYVAFIAVARALKK